MKKKDYNAELRRASGEELEDKGLKAAEELMKLRFRSAAGQLEQSHRLRETRLNLARVLTEKRKRVISSEARA